MESNNLIPTVLLFAALMELLMTPMVVGKVPGRQKLIVGFAMFSGSVMTAAVGAAFYFGWIGG